jgi:hypothetical protein
MKKTLVALAVLAASGASFAQVSLTGTLAMGYEIDGSSKGATASGLGIDTSALNFTAVEDIGGGTKVTALMGFDGLNRAAVGGGDAALSVAGSFGTVKLQLARGADYLSGGTAGVAGLGLDGKLFSALWADDAVSYTSPKIGGFNVVLSHEEVNPTAETAAQGVGIGVGAAGAYPSNYQRRNGLGFKYAGGPLVVDGAYQAYDQQGDAPAANATSTSTPNMVSRTRLSASYDLGVVKLGAGFDSRKLVAGTRVDSLIGVSVPFGALRLGAEIGTRKYDGTDQGYLDGTRNGFGLIADYSLSKRTTISARYAKFDTTTLNSAQTAANSALTSNTYTALLLAHSF